MKLYRIHTKSSKENVIPHLVRQIKGIKCAVMVRLILVSL